MLIVEVRWRPSGGRGEYEHVPSSVLLDRNVVVASSIAEGALITTDVRGCMRDGKPRLRRSSPNDRSILNLPQLVAALALLPDPIREDPGVAALPLRAKKYVVSSITFDVHLEPPGRAICTPLSMRILHGEGQVDLGARLQLVGELLRSELVPHRMIDAAADFLQLVDSGNASSLLRKRADELLQWISADAEATKFLDKPGELQKSKPAPDNVVAVSLLSMSADETRRKLKTHYQIDRSRKIRFAKVEDFRSKYGAIYCENCSFDFSKRYGNRGDGFIEVHHVIPLAALLPNTTTYLTDLMLLCSNCHRMVHRRRPDLTPDELKALTNLSPAK